MSITTESAPADAALNAGATVRKTRKRRGISGPHPVDIHAGSRLRLRRMLLGMSQTAIGERVGLTFQQIQKYERGANRMGASRLHELAGVLEVPVAYFFEDLPEGSVGEAPGQPDGGIGKHELRLLSAYRGIGNAEIRKSVYELMRSVVRKAPAGR